MLDQARGLLSQDFAVDLGSTNVRVSARGRGLVVDEPAVVVVEQQGQGGRVRAVGGEAKEMLGRTPGNIRVVWPIQHGQIDDFELAEALLASCLQRAQGSRPRMRMRTVVCVPSGLSDVQRRAVQESARAAGAREVILVPTVLAAAVGCGLPVTQPVASLVVDIGGGITEVGVVSLGGIVHSEALTVGGQTMDEALVAWLREHHGVLVGARTAEELKIALGGRLLDEQPPVARVKGRALDTGIPREITVTASDLHGALQEPLQTLVEGLRGALKGTSPEAAADILEHGLVLCGGASRIAGLDRILSEQVGLPVVISEHHELAVIRGAESLLEDDPALARISL